MRSYVNFTWGLGRLTAHGSDFVSVRWEGAVRPPLASSAWEDFTFMVVCDDGVRLWVDHDLIIDQVVAGDVGRDQVVVGQRLPPPRTMRHAPTVTLLLHLYSPFLFLRASVACGA